MNVSGPGRRHGRKKKEGGMLVFINALHNSFSFWDQTTISVHVFKGFQLCTVVGAFSFVTPNELVGRPS